MKKKPGVIFFGVTEVFIGVITTAAIILSLIGRGSSKPTAVLVFVLATSASSTILGLGLLKHSLTSYYLLLYFSSVIILSKILIFSGIITLNGALETAIPSSIKNIISVLYHCLLIFYLTRKSTKREFSERAEITSPRRKDDNSGR